MGKKVITTNKKAFHDFLILEKYNAGIVLTGTEIKSIRKAAINLKDSFAKIEDGEVWLYNAHINPYEQGNRFNHEAERRRKLLLNKNEILKMLGKVKKKSIQLFLLVCILKTAGPRLKLHWLKENNCMIKENNLHKNSR